MQQVERAYRQMDKTFSKYGLARTLDLPDPTLIVSVVFSLRSYPEVVGEVGIHPIPNGSIRGYAAC